MGGWHYFHSPLGIRWSPSAALGSQSPKAGAPQPAASAGRGLRTLPPPPHGTSDVESGSGDQPRPSGGTRWSWHRRSSFHQAHARLGTLPKPRRPEGNRATHLARFTGSELSRTPNQDQSAEPDDRGTRHPAYTSSSRERDSSDTPQHYCKSPRTTRKRGLMVYRSWVPSS